MNTRGQAGPRKRRRHRALAQAVRAVMERLEQRVLLTGALFYVNDNWQVVTDTGAPGLSAGDTVDNSGAGDDGALHDLTYGTSAFGSLASALAAAGVADRVVVVSGSYTESVTLSKGLSLEGWAYFAGVSALPNANPDSLHVTQSLLTGAPAQVSGVQWSVNDSAAENISVRGFAFSALAGAGTIHAAATNAAALTVRENTFSDGGTGGVAIRVDAGASAPSVDVGNNSFAGAYAAVQADKVTGSVSGNLITGARQAIRVTQGSNLTLSNNTISGLTTGAVVGVGILSDNSGAGVVISGNHLTVDQNRLGVVVSHTGASVAVTGNVINQGALLGFAGVMVTDSGANYGGTNGSASAVVSGNQISGMEFGVAVDGFGNLGAVATVSGNTLIGDTKGVYLQGMAQAGVTGNAISGASAGIDVEADGSALISGNSINGSSTGIFYNSAAAGTITGMHFEGGTPNATDIDIAVGDLLVFAGGDHLRGATFVTNESATDFTLPGEDFGTSDGAEIDGRIIENPGLINWVLSDYYVKAGVSTIQAAVNAAASGNIIHIGTGHFMEQVTVLNKDLTLTGAGQGLTFIDSPDTLATSFVTSAVNKAVVTFMGQSAGNINHLTIDGRSTGNTNTRFIGLAYRNAGGQVDHVTVSNIRNTPLNNVEAGVGIYAFNDTGSMRTLSIQYSTVTGYQKTGMSLSGLKLTTLVDQNVVTGAGVTGIIAQNGIQVGYGASGVITNNTVSGNQFTGSTAQGTGILVFNARSGVIVASNALHHNDAGIATNSPTSIVQNVVSDGLDGIQLLANQSVVLIANNIITNNQWRGLYLDTSVTGLVLIHDNSFTLNGVAALANDSVVTPDASGNWWGDVRGPATALNTYDTVPPATTGGVILGNAVIVPWRSSGADTSADMGFQPAGAADATVPALAVSGQTAYAGYAAALDLGTITDAWTATGDWHVKVNWGDGSPVESFYSATTAIGTRNHTYSLAATGSETVTVSVTDGSGNTTSSSFAVTVSVASLTNTVEGRWLFYGESSFDTGGHDGAIATDKSALLAGGTGTLANYSSYDRGINGVMVDIAGAIALTPGDVTFATGNDNEPEGWTPPGAAATITVRPGAGVGASNRVEITFADGAVRNTWLQVTVHAGPYTGLAADEVFYFGNAVGEAGNSAGSARVDAIDELTARAFMEIPPATALIDNHFDFNRDGAVDPADLVIARSNISWFLNELHLIEIPAPPVLLNMVHAVPSGPTGPTGLTVLADAPEEVVGTGPVFGTVALSAIPAGPTGATATTTTTAVATILPATIPTPTVATTVEAATITVPVATKPAATKPVAAGVVKRSLVNFKFKPAAHVEKLPPVARVVPHAIPRAPAKSAAGRLWKLFRR